MKLALALLAVALSLNTQAQTLRWASQGDMQTLDPHSQNEILTNTLNNYSGATTISGGALRVHELAFACGRRFCISSRTQGCLLAHVGQVE